MKLSVITPVKNCEKFLSDTIESVINQHGDFEIEYLIIDGGSVDDTLKICKDYEQQLKNATRKLFCKAIDLIVISKPDNGIYDALASGVKLVTGEIVCYINSDDFYLPNAFNCITEVFAKYTKVQWITGLPIRYNEKGHNTNFEIPWEYNSGLISKGFNGTCLPIIQQESVFWRSELNKIIDLEKLRNCKLAGDYLLWHSFAVQGTKLYIVDSFLGGNRLRTGQLSEDKQNYLREFNTIRNKANVLDYVKVFFYWFMGKFAGKPLKKRLSKNRISFKNGSWLLK